MNTEYIPIPIARLKPLLISLVVLFLIVCISAFTGLAPAHAQTEQQAIDGVDESLEALDDFEIFEDIELLEAVDVGAQESSAVALAPSTKIQISNIIVTVDSQIYRNPTKDTLIPKRATVFAVLFSEIPVRLGSVYTKNALDSKIPIWSLRVERNAYFGTSSIEYRISEEESTQKGTKEESEPRQASMYITLSSSYEYIYLGGNAYATLGYKYRNGLISIYHLGGNRAEVELENESVLVQNASGGYAKLPLIIGGKVRTYWSWPNAWSSTLLYGSDAYFGLRPFAGARLLLGAQVLGLSTFSNALSAEEIQDIGLPKADNTGLSMGLRAKFSYSLPFMQKGFYKPGFSINIPIILGYWNAASGEALDLFDSYGMLINYSIAYKLLLHQRIHVNTAVVTNGFSKTQPFHAKANMKNGFYHNYLLDSSFSRRGGGYNYAKYVGSKGMLAGVEYGFLLLEKELIALGLHAFYDVGTVANELTELANNIVQSTGPGVSLYIAGPANIVLNVNMVIGGSVLSNPGGGDSIGIDFSVDWIEE